MRSTPRPTPPNVIVPPGSTAVLMTSDVPSAKTVDETDRVPTRPPTGKLPAAAANLSEWLVNRMSPIDLPFLPRSTERREVRVSISLSVCTRSAAGADPAAAPKSAATTIPATPRCSIAVLLATDLPLGHRLYPT